MDTDTKTFYYGRYSITNNTANKETTPMLICEALPYVVVGTCVGLIEVAVRSPFANFALPSEPQIPFTFTMVVWTTGVLCISLSLAPFASSPYWFDPN